MKKHTRTALAVLFALILAAPSAASAQRTHVTDRWECSEIPAYQQAVYEALPEDSAALMRVIESDDPTTLRPSVLRDASDQADEWATNLEEMPRRDIPKAVREYHTALVDQVSILSIFLLAMSNGNMLGMLAYVDTIEQVTADLDAANYSASVRCPNDWEYSPSESDEDDASKEI